LYHCLCCSRFYGGDKKNPEGGVLDHKTQTLGKYATRSPHSEGIIPTGDPSPGHRESEARPGRPPPTAATRRCRGRRGPGRRAPGAAPGPGGWPRGDAGMQCCGGGEGGGLSPSVGKKGSETSLGVRFAGGEHQERLRVRSSSTPFDHHEEFMVVALCV